MNIFENKTLFIRGLGFNHLLSRVVSLSLHTGNHNPFNELLLCKEIGNDQRQNGQGRACHQYGPLCTKVSPRKAGNADCHHFEIIRVDDDEGPQEVIPEEHKAKHTQYRQCRTDERQPLCVCRSQSNSRHQFARLLSSSIGIVSINCLRKKVANALPST